MLKIEIKTDNSSFDYPDGNKEIKRILMEVCNKIEEGRNQSFIIDLNGNFIGKWEFSK